MGLCRHCSLCLRDSSRTSVDGYSSVLVCACVVCGPKEEADRHIGEVTAKSCSLQATLGKHGPPAGPLTVNHTGTQCVCVGRLPNKERGVELPRDAFRGTLMALLP